MQTQYNPDGVSFAAVMGRIDAQMGKNTHALLQEYRPGAVDVHELSPSEARGFIWRSLTMMEGEVIEAK